MLLLAVLTALLVGPWFVDWNAQREQIEALLGEATGLTVSIGGDLDVKLLPIPRMHLAQVSVRPAQGGEVIATAADVSMEMAVAPLLHGAFRFVEMRIAQPRITLAGDGSGGVILPPLSVSASADVSFERLSISDGTVVVTRPGAPALTFDQLTLDTDSPALEGPYKGQGWVRAFGRVLPFRFGTSVKDASGLRAKLIVEQAEPPVRAELDGLVTLSAGKGRGQVPGFEGALTLAGTVSPTGEAVSWRVNGPVRLEDGALRLEPADIRLGAEGRAIAANGAASLTLGDTVQVFAKLTAAQADLDLFANEKRDPAAGMALLRDMIGALSAQGSAVLPGMAFNFDGSVPVLIVGGETVTDAHLRLERPAGRTSVDLGLEAGLPGRAEVKASGVLQTGAAARFTGEGALNLRDPLRFGQWLGRGWPDFAMKLDAIAPRALDVRGAVEISPAAIAVQDIKIAADRSTLTGSVAFTQPVGNTRGKLVANLSSQALDLEGLPDIGTPLRSATGLDLDLSLDARAVRIARFGSGMVDSGRIRIRLSRIGDVLKLDDVTIDNLGGANLSARGESRPGAARLEARLDADRLVELAALVRRVAPGPLAEAFASRAVALSPARLTLNAEGTDVAPAAIASLKLDGTARGTNISGTVSPGSNGRAVAAQFNFDNADAHMLLRQMGFETVALSRFGAGRVQVQANGRSDGSYGTKVDASLAGTTLAFDGTATPRAGTFEGDGRVRLASGNLAPLLQILALALPDPTASVPADGSGMLRISDGGFVLADATGKIGGSAVSGRLERAAGNAQLTGALDVDRLSLASLASLVFGPAQPPRAGQRWADLKFAPAPIDAPKASLVVKAGQFEPGGGLAPGPAQFRLGLDAGALAFDDLRLKTGPATVSGSLNLRRDRDQGSLSGKLAIATPLAGHFDMEGQADGTFEFAGSGTSEATLIGGLGGHGAVNVSALRIANADSAALDQTIAAIEREQLAVEPTKVEAQMQKALAAGPLALDKVSLDATIAGGVLRLQSPVFATPAGPRGQIGASFDLRTFGAEATLDLASMKPPKDWSGDAPRARLVRREMDGRVERTLEIAPLANGLSGRAIEREAARAAALEADIRERAMFNRRLRAQEFLKRREAEIAAWKLEQARLAEEKAAKAREAERQAERQAQEAARARAEMERRVQDVIRSAPVARPPIEVVPRPQPHPPAVAPPRDPSPSGIY
ncbi:AsmA-like C-terminal region [Beijerinckia sp. 28-YEA-48]|nr:AsmA-like C-terminal region [Beijerinckia sp. 28-YEA-48]